jgi:hypothetical protein
MKRRQLLKAGISVMPALAFYNTFGKIGPFIPLKHPHVILNYLPNYNIIWNSQSKNSSQSMPFSGGQIGCNVWVENGEILLYAQQSGAFDKNGEYLKMGRFRIKLEPNPFEQGLVFKQEFKLKEGFVQLTGEFANKKEVIVNFWIEVHRPVIHIDVLADEELSMTAAYESWRFKDVVIPPDTAPNSWRRSSIYDFHELLQDVVKKGDVIKPAQDSIVWYQNNAQELNAFGFELENEHLGYLSDKMWDPLENLISGGTMRCPGLEYTGTSQGIYTKTPFRAWNFISKEKSKKFNIAIFGQIEKSETSDKWESKLNEFAAEEYDPVKKWADNLEWWKKFWSNSYVMINPDHSNDDIGWRVGRNFNLVRYAFGGNTYGMAPTKFNGGNYTYDAFYGDSNYDYDPDYRRWGGWSYTAANQSLVYWPYLKNGDFEGMLAEFDIYRNALENSELRTLAHFGHEGCSFAEQTQTSGFPVASQYGFEKNGIKYGIRTKDVPKGELQSPWIVYFYHGQLEHAFMILEYYRFSGRDISAYMPFIISCIKFYDQHYQLYHNLMDRMQMKPNPLDANGKLVIFPSTAGERYPAKNPAEVIAGLTAVTKAMLNLPDTLITTRQREYFESFKKRIPDLPKKMVDINGRNLPVFIASEDDNHQGEGFLHSVYPYNLVFPGTADYQTAINTIEYKAGGLFPGGKGIYAARTGNTDQAKANVIMSLENCDPAIGRFPTFCLRGDWGPDHNWGGRGLSNTQEMLLQTPGTEIRLLPAWPKDWDVTFKLHAPYNTTVEAVVKGGKLRSLKVVPESRAKDVVIMNGF